MQAAQGSSFFTKTDVSLNPRCLEAMGFKFVPAPGPGKEAPLIGPFFKPDDKGPE
jgi:hypothetical protein